MKNISLTTEELVIVDRLKQMKMSGMAEAYEEQIKNPNSDLSGFYERFSSIVNYEWELRFNKKFNRFLKKATLRYPQAAFDGSTTITVTNKDGSTTTELVDGTARTEVSNLALTKIDRFGTNASMKWDGNILKIEATDPETNVPYAVEIGGNGIEFKYDNEAVAMINQDQLVIDKKQ